MLGSIVNRWLVLMWNEIDSARKQQQSDVHLLAGTRRHPRDVNTVCPSQIKWPLACPCLDRYPN